ncbi:amidohydrolase [Alkalicoccus saliphilus]|uniref:5-methylthioadenosine/S-adenosylhomocysteine deaminase n=1 Tax=Alkalicoccus saliphilus TaxID=200989 RepID=A0A2T4UAC8_9BACI|nr:amidohydrolase [Alkalicoccus saliphilus]PTL40339.1 N-ethylammeline chlorohydrolase [Alkalicoccus saliphilus]
MTEIIKNVVIVNPEMPPEEGWVMIKGDEVIKTGSGTPKEQADVVTDGGGGWLLPGFVNTHGHAGSSLLRGAGDDMPLHEWLKNVMWPNEKRFDKNMVEAAGNLALAEMIKSGTTSFLDMYHLHMGEFAEKIDHAGLKAVLGRGMIGFGNADEQKGKLSEAENLAAAWHMKGNGRIRIGIMPHAPYTCPPDFMLKAAEIASSNNLLFHTHCAETSEETEEHIKRYGLHPVDHLNDLGIFDLNVLLAHAVHISPAHMDLFAEKHTAVSHNPKSNLKLGSGIAPAAEMMRRGVNVTIGTDSTASNNTLDMVEEMRMAAMLHKGKEENPASTAAEDILKAATIKGASALQFPDTGIIAPGWKADLILVDTASPHLTPALPERAVSHIVYAMKSTDIKSVWIHGSQVMKNRELLTLDEERVLFEADKQAKKLL